MRTLRVMLALTVAGAMFAAGVAVASAAPVPVKAGVAAPEQFPPPNSCGCHAALLEQWSKSMHAKALTDPLYNAKLADANAATNGTLGAFCNTCHGPAATMTGEMSKDASLSAGTAVGIGCSWCHQVTGLKPGDPGNTSQVLELTGTMRAQIQDPQAPHFAKYSPLHTESRFCGGCHNVNHPVNGMHLESTYSEWEKSPYAAQGVSCQDCHMSGQPGAVGPSKGAAGAGAPERPNIFAMSFMGAQVGLGDKALAEGMLQSAATVTLASPEIVAPGSSAAATVTVTNSGAGHYLPTGLTEVRE
ncbi:MAG: hypothetical protein FDZ75_01445, partial [Actinobacteria bacterium]